jgi:hypothetical protein
MSETFNDLKQLLRHSEMKDEMEFIKRWLYKNRNQHKSIPYYRRLDQCCRILKRLHGLELPLIYKAILNKTLLIEDACIRIIQAHALLEHSLDKFKDSYL